MPPFGWNKQDAVLYFTHPPFVGLVIEMIETVLDDSIGLDVRADSQFGAGLLILPESKFPIVANHLSSLEKRTKKQKVNLLSLRAVVEQTGESIPHI